MMNDMFADIIKKALPPEVVELMKPENIKAFGDKITASLEDHRAQMTRIEDMLLTLVEKSNDGSNDSGKLDPCGDGNTRIG